MEMKIFGSEHGENSLESIFLARKFLGKLFLTKSFLGRR
jgi:hypothetical protein